jgi:hypothetical protein
MISTEKKEDVLPLCPHCKTELSTLWYRELMKDMGKRCIYFCPHCRAVVGISHRKGLTMGW